MNWVARAWLPYLLAGVAWVTLGAFGLGDPKGLGLVFVGQACLGIGGYGAVWRLRHGYRLSAGSRPTGPKGWSGSR